MPLQRTCKNNYAEAFAANFTLTYPIEQLWTDFQQRIQWSAHQNHDSAEQQTLNI